MSQVVFRRDMLEVVDSEPRQPILVRDHQSGYLAALDRVHDRHELSASQVHPATDLADPLVHCQTTRETEPLHRLDLCREIVLPPRRGHPALPGFPMVDLRPMLGSALVDPLFTTKMEVSAVNRRGREINVQLVCSALRTAEGTPQGAILVMEQRE
jgi:hypothetical protein